MLRSLATLPSRRPFGFGVGISSLKTGAADLFTQRWVEGRDEVDTRRLAVFLTWGAVYLGGVHYFIYSHIFPRVLFPSAAAFVAKPFAERLADRAGQLVVVQQVALDQFIHHPLVLFPCFYCVKETVEQGRAGSEVVIAGLRKYATNICEDCVVCWSTWVPAFLINFSVCPIHMRIPFVAVVSFGFTSYWSLLRGRRQELE